MLMNHTLGCCQRKGLATDDEGGEPRFTLNDRRPPAAVSEEFGWSLPLLRRESRIQSLETRGWAAADGSPWNNVATGDMKEVHCRRNRSQIGNCEEKRWRGGLDQNEVGGKDRHCHRGRQRDRAGDNTMLRTRRRASGRRRQEPKEVGGYPTSLRARLLSECCRGQRTSLIGAPSANLCNGPSNNPVLFTSLSTTPQSTFGVGGWTN